jgi:hypothetical protein
MENIKEKFSTVYRWNEEHHGEIFIDRKYKDDLEWLILGYMTRMLKLGEELLPVYAEKTSPPEPDFITYDRNKKLFSPIEITEVLHPNRKRGEEYKKEIENGKIEANDKEKQNSEKNEKENTFTLLDKKEWIQQVVERLRNKFSKRYRPDTWLLIYFNIPYFHIAHYGWWHITMKYFAEKWLHSDIEEYKDLKNPPYSRILMINSSGDAMIQLHPSVYVIKEEISKPLWEITNLDEW